MPVHYGGDYNPEQFSRDVWEEDVRLMKEAHVTLVTVGVFAWSRIQAGEGEFDWEWLDTVLDLLHRAGIGVDLATATASPPPWLISRYPDVLPVNEDGTVWGSSSRQHYAPTSPVYRRLAAELVEALVERYANHPAIVMWHVNNEYGCHVIRDYSEHAARAFRRWLKGRYGDVATLNEAWGTAFWSQIVTSFDEIQPPRKAPHTRNPAAVLDFKRFTSDALLDLYRMERDIIRAHGATQPITTNFMGAFEGADYWTWADELDILSDDVYPDPNDPFAFRESAFAHDLMRSLKPGRPWLLMEQAAEAVTWRRSNAPKAPGQLEALSAQAVARGADGILFFQWRQSRRGAEQFLTAMLPHAGTRTRTWREVMALGGALADLPKLPAPDSAAEVAIVFDWASGWALDGADLPVSVDYRRIVRDWYDALHALHVPVDLVRPGSDLSCYRAVIAPALYLLGVEDARNLSMFVHDGGHLLATPYTDIVDESAGFRPGGFQTLLRDALGVTTLQFGALVPPPGEQGSGGPGEHAATVSGEAGTFTGGYLAEEVDVLEAAVRARFKGGRRDGDAALTSHRYGDGIGHYLATFPDSEGAQQVAEWLLRQAGVRPPYPGLPAEVELVKRGSILFAINHGSSEVTVPVAGTDVRSGAPVDGARVPPQGWIAVRSSTISSSENRTHDEP